MRNFDDNPIFFPSMRRIFAQSAWNVLTVGEFRINFFTLSFISLAALGEHRSVLEGKTVILCVPSLYLDMVSSFVKEAKLPIFIGAQYVSQFPKGSFTGEQGAFQIAQYASFTLVGHSERRIHLHE